jgi:uncharacterized protein YodC (DUF2158 family)
VNEDGRKEAETFRKGQVVQLRSGGPRMTVVGSERSGRGEMLARVVYFHEKDEKFVYESIIPEALTLES